MSFFSFFKTALGFGTSDRPASPAVLGGMRDGLKAAVLTYLLSKGFSQDLSNEAIVALDAFIFGVAGILGKLVRNWMAAKGVPGWVLNFVPI